MEKAEFIKKKTLFTSKLDEETCEMLHLERGIVWCCNLDDSGSRSETPGKF
jgi:hypothetical protein